MKPNALALFASMAIYVLTVGSAQAGGGEPIGSISGTKFEDVNGNGTRDMGIDVPFEGVTIELDGTDDFGNPISLSTTTGSDGNYSFTQLPSGFYTVAEDLNSLPGLPGEVVPTTDTEIPIAIFGDNGFSEVIGQDFGNTILGSIHGFKFFDFDANGIYEPNISDTPLDGVIFELTGVTGMGDSILLSSDPTNADGEFWFTELMPGEYTVTEIVPSGHLATTSTSGNFILESGQELVWADGAAMLPDGTLRYETNVGTALMFGNTRITVPAPATLALISLGMAGLGYRRRKQIKAA